MNLNNKEHKVWQIWMEGYAATGEYGTAHKIAEIEAGSFDEAVEKYRSQFSEEELQKNCGPFRSPGNGRSNWSIWGSSLFDTAEEARESFG